MTYRIHVFARVFERGSGFISCDGIESSHDDKVYTAGPEEMSPEYLRTVDDLSWVIDDLPEEARQHDGDDSETLWSLEAYALDEDGCPEDEPSAVYKVWECELWSKFRPENE